MSARRSRGRSGGPATAAGIDFQARLAAWMACSILAETEASPLWDWPETETFESVFAETDQPTDDLLVRNSAGARAYVQAKYRLQLSEGITSQLASALEQFVGQYRSFPGGARPDDRLVLAVGPETSSLIREVLPRVLLRLRALPAGEVVSAAAKNKQEGRVIRIVAAHVSREWEAAVGDPPSDDELKAVLASVRVSTHALYDDGAEVREAKSLLRQSILTEPSEAGRVWAELISMAVRFGADQSGTNRALLQRSLTALGVSLRVAPSYRGDVDKLLAHSRQTIDRLARFSTIRKADGEAATIKRSAPNALRKVVERQSVVVTGDPGAGKTATLFELAGLSDGSRDVVALASDTLAAASLGELRDELGLEHEVVEVLQNWPGTRHGILIVDALDAARGERTQEALLDLIGSVATSATDRWRIAASIRRFDLRYNLDLQALFTMSSPAAGVEYQSPEFPSLSHFNVPLLSDEELQQLSALAPELHGIVDSATSELRSLARVPFNLRLLAELVSIDVARAELEPITTQLQLLDKYWEHRVLRSDVGGDALEAVLRTACEAMIDSRSMRIDRSQLQQPASADSLMELLSNQVLAEEETDGFVRREVVAFAHHVLFDYAVARLLFRGTEDTIVRRTQAQRELLLIVRPSYDLHFRHLWGVDADRRSFWDLAIDFAARDDVPQIGKIIGPGAGATLTESLEDVSYLLGVLSGDRQAAAEEVLRHLVGSRLAGGTLGEDIPPERRAVWSEITEAISGNLVAGTAYLVGSLVMELCHKPELLDLDQKRNLGEAGRRLLVWSWNAPRYDRWLVGRALEAVARTFPADPGSSEALLRDVLTPDRLVAHGFEEMPELAREVSGLVREAPQLVRDIYVTAFEFEETSDETTQMRGGVLALSSHRSQDYRMAHHALGETFPEFLRVATLEAIDALSSVCRAYAHRRGASFWNDEVIEAEWGSGRVSINPDASHIWDSNGSHNDEVGLLDTYEAWLTEAVNARGSKAVRPFLNMLVSEARPAALWRRVFGVMALTPAPFIPLIEPLIRSSDVLTSSDLSSAVGDVLVASFRLFSKAARKRIEVAVTRLPDGAGDGTDEKSVAARERLERIRDRLLGCLAEEALVTSAAKNRLQELRAADAVPENRPPFQVSSYTRSYGEREVLAEAGIDPDAEPNRRLRELEEPVETFAEQYRNEAPSTEAVDAIAEPLGELWRALQSADEDGVDTAQADYGWGYATEAAEAITRATGIATDVPAFEIAAEVLKAAADHRLPEPRHDDPARFDEHTGWSPPAPRLEAAGGLVSLAFHQPADDEILARVEDLSRDQVPAVRFQVAQRLHLLRRDSPDLMWRLTERIVNDDPSTAILSAVVAALPRMTLPDAHDRLEETVRLIFERSEQDRAGVRTLREHCIGVMTDLFIWRGHTGAGDFVHHEVIPRIDIDPEQARHIVQHIREPLAHGSVTPSMPEHTAIRQRTVELTTALLERAIAKYGEINEALIENPPETDDDPRVKMGREVAHIIDGIAAELYFASGIFDEKQQRDTHVDLSTRERLYREAAPVLDQLIEVPLPPITHHVLETLEGCVSFDPRGVFLRIGRTLRAGQAGGYHTDSLGAELFVRLMERYLAEHRTLLQQDVECRQVLIEVLDIFVRAGWPQARKLTYGLQDIFR
jgi:hypothetical protein